jgi:leader peptidase (prepilin peptidase)/N-methyltransferase
MWQSSNGIRIVAGSAALAIALVSLAVLPAGEAAMSTALGAAMMAVAAIDAEEMRIPDWISLPAIPLGLLASGSLIDGGIPGMASESHLVGMVVGFGALWLLATGYRRWRGRDGLGLGDVKLGAAAGAWVGVELLATVLLAAAISALVAVAVATRLGRLEASWAAAIPFGTFLAPAIWLVWFLGQAKLIG